jgi:hypothetical protein
LPAAVRVPQFFLTWRSADFYNRLVRATTLFAIFHVNQNDNSSSDVIEVEPSLTEDYGIRVDGKALVLPSGCTMPLKCVKTNQPVAEGDMIFTNLSWCPPYIALFFFLLGGLPFLFVYFVGRKHCAITYGLSRDIRRRKGKFAVAKVFVMFALFVGAIAMAVSDSRNRLVGASAIVLFVLFLISVVAVFIGNSALRVTRHENGLFWIKGFSQEFLDGLEF